MLIAASRSRIRGLKWPMNIYSNSRRLSFANCESWKRVARDASALKISQPYLRLGLATGIGFGSLWYHQNHGNHTVLCEMKMVEGSDDVVTAQQLLKLEQSSSFAVQVLKNIYRSMQLLITFAPCIISFPLFALHRYLAENGGQWWYSILVRCLQYAGPTFIKLGQWASTRADLFSAEFRHHLRALHDACFLETRRKTVRTLENAFGADLDSLFLAFDYEPVGAGCIAQVHKAKLRSNPNAWVAVKVQRTGALETITRDLNLVSSLVWFLNCLMPRIVIDLLALDRSVDLFSDFMLSQMDFHREARNLSRFRANFEQFQVKGHHVEFPKPIQVSKCGNVLIESYEEGIPLSRILHGVKAEEDHSLHKLIGKLGVQTFLKMVLIDNFCHSDLHPGNILVKLDKNHQDRESLDRMIIIDVGLTTELSKKDQENFLELFAAVATGNGRLAGRLIIERADQTRMPKSVNEEAFVDGIEQVVSNVQMESFRLDKVQIGNVLEQVLSLVRTHRVPLDPSFTNLVLSIIVLEGLGRQLDPEMDIFKESLPILWKLDSSKKLSALKALRELGKKK